MYCLERGTIKSFLQETVLILFATALHIASVQASERIRVACVGNSITYGAYIENREQNSYPAQLQRLMGPLYDVRNFGVNGQTTLRKGDYPYMSCSAYQEALQFNPDIVIIKLGTNDSKPHNWVYKDDFRTDMKDLIHSFKALSSKPRIYLCLPVPAWALSSGIDGKALTDEIIPAIREVAQEEELPIIDLYSALEPYYPALFPDKCHPNAEGAGVMARHICKTILGDDFRRINARTLPTNAFLRFRTQKEGCVAFLGGSITEMNGWRNRMKEDLQLRFPDTRFTFIEAGIASTGTTPHAFRLEHDVLNQGVPDLLFVEAAVNDDTNYFSAIEQVRGMEGIVRHALAVNPAMDIVMLHFIHDPFIPILNEGKRPDVITNHEKVAEHYAISSIDLADEVAARMRAGELTWEEFGGTHPAPLGHRIYAATINRLFDQTDQALSTVQAPSNHALPSMLDEFSYSHGRFVDIREARKLKRFHVEEDWAPAAGDNAGTRYGFVHVPMLVADDGGASFRLDFEGTAVGIFCVAGPHACTFRYRTDKGAWKTLDTRTEWSKGLYIPWVYMFEEELPAGKHRLEVKIVKGEDTACQIRNFVVNDCTD